MNVNESVKLYQWLAPQKEALENDGSSASALAARATAELAFKVSPGSIKQTLEAAGIAMKLKKSSAKDDVENLTDLCCELAKFGTFPESFVSDILEDASVPAAVKEALTDAEDTE